MTGTAVLGESPRPLPLITIVGNTCIVSALQASPRSLKLPIYFKKSEKEPLAGRFTRSIGVVAALLAPQKLRNALSTEPRLVDQGRSMSSYRPVMVLISLYSMTYDAQIE